MPNCLCFTALAVTLVCCLGCHVSLLSWPLHWFSALPVTLVWCLGRCIGLLCVMMALYVTLRRESAVGCGLRECVADCRALPPVLLCRKARLSCLHSSTMQLTALSLLIVNFLFVPVLESPLLGISVLEFPLLGIPVLKVRMLGVPVLVSVLVHVSWRLTVCVSAVSGKRVPPKGSTRFG